MEDEPPMLRFLRRLISGLEGFEVTAEALSAEEAVRILETSETDLLISDIRMPGMSGLELAEKCRQLSSGMHIIIVTGYKTFEYAKAAIDLNIDAFITKPIDPEEFSEVLGRIREAYQEKYLEETRRQLEKAFQYNEESLFFRTLSGQEYLPCRVIIVYYAGDVAELLCSITHFGDKFIVIHYKNAAVFFVKEENAKEVFRYITVKFSGAARKKNTIVCAQMDSSVDACPTIAQIKDFYRKQILQMVVPGSFQAYTAEALREADQRAAAYSRDEGLYQKLELSILSKDWNGMWKHMAAIFAVWRKDQLPTSHLRRRIHGMMAVCDQAGVLKTDRISLNDQMDETIVCLDSYEEAEHFCVGLMKANLDMGTSVLAKKENKDRELFEQIRKLVLQNLSHSYSLQEICNLFKVSQPYVRKIFIGQTGKTYNDYILEEKLSHAANRINSNPHIPVKDLAAMLGFEQLYFSTVFKKKMGLTPSQYKQAVLEAAMDQEQTGGEHEA